MKSRARVKSVPTASELVARVRALAKNRRRLRAQPPTDEKLAQIWPPWNACPAEFLPEQRTWTLTGNPNARMQKELNRLKPQFSFLPLDANDFASTLTAAEQWAALIDLGRSTNEKFSGRIEAQLAFNESDSQASGRIAIFRAQAELKLTKPGLLQMANPRLADIALLRARYEAYLQARILALQKLDSLLYSLLYKLPGIRKGTPVALSRRAHGVPHPPDDIPHYLYIARLDALDLCSEKRLLEFFREDMPSLSRVERQQFYLVSLKPRYGKDRLAPLAVWLADNRPVFQRFDWRPDDIHERARQLKIPIPTGTNALQTAKLASDWNLGLRLRRCVRPANWKPDIQRSTSLLSPPPIIVEAVRPSD